MSNDRRGEGRRFHLSVISSKPHVPIQTSNGVDLGNASTGYAVRGHLLHEKFVTDS